MSNEIVQVGNLPAVSSETAAIMQMIEQIALNPQADVEKLRAVMDMMNIGYTTLHYMVRQKYIVVNDQLYSPKRKITKIKKM